MKKIIPILAASLILAACTGGGENNSSSSVTGTSINSSVSDADSSVATSSSTSEMPVTPVSSDNNDSSSQQDTKSSSEKPSSSVQPDVPAKKYTVTITPCEGISNPNVVSQEKEFAAGETIQFSCPVVYKYRVVAIHIRGTDGVDIAYTKGQSLYSFTMPASNVTISFEVEVRQTITVEKDSYTTVTFSDKGLKDYFDEGEAVSFTLSFEEGYELGNLKAYNVSGSTTTEVQYAESKGIYTLTFGKTDMKIVVTAKEKEAAADDPFTSAVTYQGSWTYDYDYTMRLRIIFNGNSTLDWYLTYEYVGGEEEWTYQNGSVSNATRKNAASTAYSKPSGMDGDFKSGYKNVPYTYDAATDKIEFTTPVKMTTATCHLQINRTSGSVTSITVLEDLSSDYYQSKNCVLTKI